MREDSEQYLVKFANEVRKTGKRFPSGVSDINPFPYATHAALCEAVRSRDILLHRFSPVYDNNIFEVFASSGQKNLNLAYLLLAFSIPVVALGLGIFVSWWWLFGALGFFISLKASKNIYNSVILSAALNSDRAFAFLYVTRQVSLTSPDFSKSIYWSE